MSGGSIQVRDATVSYHAEADAQHVPPGFKITQVGVIPENWDVRTLGEVCEGIYDGTHQTPKYVQDGIPFFSVENVTSNDFSNTKLISREEHERLSRRVQIERGDILLTRIGSLGETKLIKWEVSASFYVSLALLKPSRRVSASYLSAYSKSRQFVLDVEKRSLLHAYPKKINLGNISDIPIPLPTIREQRLIAEALADLDELLGALEGLIAKKRALKQAAMQQLLTGRTRLPGFSGEWEIRRIGDLFDVSVGSSKSKFIIEGGKRFIVDMGAVSQAGQLIALKPTNYEGDLLQKGDLVMPKDDIGGGKIIGKVAYINADDKYVLGDHVYVLRLREGNPLFFSFLINRHETNWDLRSKVAGSAQLGLAQKEVLEQGIPSPPPREQIAIATLLSDMDAEIAALERRRDKTRAIKQGMMQQLLTGRVRLIEPAPEDAAA